MIGCNGSWQPNRGQETRMTVGTLFRIKKFALHDGPGIRTTLFLKGCPLSCPWCHNPEGIDPRPQILSRCPSSGKGHEKVGRVMAADALMGEIEKDLIFYDESGGGVTFSGGEPLFQPQFLESILALCNQREIHAALDTSGFAPAGVVDRMLPRLQLILFDLKVMDADRHRRLTGVSNRIILENLQRIDASGTPLRIRVPLIPGMTDDADNLEAIVRFAGSLQSVQGVDLLPFHRTGAAKYRRLAIADPMAARVPPSIERVDAIKNQFESEGFDVTVGG